MATGKRPGRIASKRGEAASGAYPHWIFEGIFVEALSYLGFRCARYLVFRCAPSLWSRWPPAQSLSSSPKRKTKHREHAKQANSSSKYDATHHISTGNWEGFPASTTAVPRPRPALAYNLPSNVKFLDLIDWSYVRAEKTYGHIGVDWDNSLFGRAGCARVYGNWAVVKALEMRIADSKPLQGRHTNRSRHHVHRRSRTRDRPRTRDRCV